MTPTEEFVRLYIKNSRTNKVTIPISHTKAKAEAKTFMWKMRMPHQVM